MYTFRASTKLKIRVPNIMKWSKIKKDLNNLSVIVDKKNTNKNGRKLKNWKVALKVSDQEKFRQVIKSQFGKSIYGEVVDKILRKTKAIEEKIKSCRS